jgi:hypothetical protein
MSWFYIRNDPNIGGQERVLYTAVLDPEVLKDELNDMVTQAGAYLLLHSWGTRPIVDGDRVNLTSAGFGAESAEFRFSARITSLF